MEDCYWKGRQSSWLDGTFIKVYQDKRLCRHKKLQRQWWRRLKRVQNMTRKFKAQQNIHGSQLWPVCSMRSWTSRTPSRFSGAASSQGQPPRCFKPCRGWLPHAEGFAKAVYGNMENVFVYHMKNFEFEKTARRGHFIGGKLLHAFEFRKFLDSKKV